VNKEAGSVGRFREKNLSIHVVLCVTVECLNLTQFKKLSLLSLSLSFLSLHFFFLPLCSCLSIYLFPSIVKSFLPLYNFLFFIYRVLSFSFVPFLSMLLFLLSPFIRPLFSFFLFLIFISIHNFLSPFCLFFFLCFLYFLLPFLLLHSLPSIVNYRCKYFSFVSSVLTYSVHFLGWGLPDCEVYTST
jgi:hypothetical protein